MKKKIIFPIISIAIILLTIAGITLFTNLLFDGKYNLLKNDVEKSEKQDDHDNSNKNKKLEINSDFLFVGTSGSGNKADNSYTAKLIILTKAGNEIELMDISKYDTVRYTYYNGKVYLYLYEYTPTKVNVETGETIQEMIEKSSIGYIDITSNKYNFVKLSDIDISGAPSSIAANNNNIYFTVDEATVIYNYSIKSNKITTEDIKFDDDLSINLYTMSNNEIIYYMHKHYIGKSVGLLNIKDGKKKELAPNANFCFIHNNKIVYEKYDNNNPVTGTEKIKYYEYDIKNNKATQISDSVKEGVSVLVIPIADYYVYASDNNLYKYKNGETIKLYEFEHSIMHITLISDTILSVDTFAGIHLGVGIEGTIDLNTLQFTNQKTNNYSDILYLK